MKIEQRKEPANTINTIQMIIQLLMVTVFASFMNLVHGASFKDKPVCLNAYVCGHTGERVCGLDTSSKEVRRFIDKCDLLEFNCEYKTIFCLLLLVLSIAAHGPPRDQDKEDVAMGRKVKKPGKMSGKWCNMARTCNHDRVPVCGLSHTGEVMGFRDLCDMFDFNCLRKRNYRQTSCPDDKTVLTASRRPSSNYYDE